VHNKHILIKFCLAQGPSRMVENYFLNKKTGDIGRGCLDLDHPWGTSTKFYCQLQAGVMSSFESCKDSYIGEKKVQKLWIHHFVIFQLFHPLEEKILGFQILKMPIGLTLLRNSMRTTSTST